MIRAEILEMAISCQQFRWEPSSRISSIYHSSLYCCWQTIRWLWGFFNIKYLQSCKFDSLTLRVSRVVRWSAVSSVRPDLLQNCRKCSYTLRVWLRSSVGRGVRYREYRISRIVTSQQSSVSVIMSPVFRTQLQLAFSRPAAHCSGSVRFLIICWKHMVELGNDFLQGIQWR